MKVLITLLVLFSTGALAQNPPRAYFPWWESPLTRDLNLTAQQQEQINSILKENREIMIDQRAVVEKAEAAVQDLFNEPEVDQARAKQAVDQLVTARGEMTRTFTVMSLKLRQVLTAGQWHRLQARRSQWDPMMRQRRGAYGNNNRWPRQPRTAPMPRAPNQPPRPPEPRQP